MKSWLKDNWFKIGILLLLLAALLLAFYVPDKFALKKDTQCILEKGKIMAEIERNNTQDWNEELIEVFYSPGLQTCLYVSHVTNQGWMIAKRLVDYRSSAGTEPIEGCAYPDPILMATAELKAKEDNAIPSQEILRLIERDRSKSYEYFCGEFDKKVKELKG